jgi:putative intracellular protease/amidase
MAKEKKIAFLVAAEGIEKAELVDPWAAVADAGQQPVLLSPESGTVQLFEHLDKADTQQVDVTVAEASVDGNLITSRKPDDIPAFTSALLEAVNHGVASSAASVS